MNIQDIKIGQQVVVNKLPTATVYKVLEKRGFNVKIQDCDYAPQWIDCSILMKYKPK